MSKSKLLMKVVEDMGSLAMSLEAVVVALALEEQGYKEDTLTDGNNLEEKGSMKSSGDGVEQGSRKRKVKAGEGMEEVKGVDHEEEKPPLIWKLEDNEVQDLGEDKVDEKVDKLQENANSLKEVVALKEITLEQVRAVLAELSRGGFTAQVKDLIKSYGASKLSEVKPVFYESLMAVAMDFKDEAMKETSNG